VAGLALAGAVLTGCGEGVTAGSGRPQLVAGEDQWGAVAAAVAGRTADIASVINNPAEDPHSYEPTAADARAVATAGVVLVNGIGYDPWIDRLLAADPTPGRRVVDVGRLLGVPDGGNPHRWYDPSDVKRVAAAIAHALTAIDPGHRAVYTARLQAFDTELLAPYDRLIASIRTRYAGTPVGASESVFAPLAAALGLRLATPGAFLKAISEGTETTAADTEAVTRQITQRAIRVWVFNAQNATPAVTSLTALARASGIPVVTITETLPRAGESFARWQTDQLTALAAALHTATRR
jgi:zinc/manganese transport system substrate-binding protein